MSEGLGEFDDLDELLNRNPAEVPADLEPELADFLPKGYLSPSQIGMFLKCPRSWELAYVQRKPRKTVARMFQGVFVHSAAEAVLKARLTSGVLPPLELATDTFSDEFEKSKNLIEDWEDGNEGSVKDTGIACTRAYYRDAAPTATPVAVEKTVTTVIKSEDGRIRLPVLGRIDSIQAVTANEEDYQGLREKVASGAETTALTRPLRVHDLKVTTNKWSPAMLENNLQFAMYAGIEHVPEVQVDMVVKGRAKVPNPRYEALTGVVTQAHVAHVMKVVEGVGKQIALGHFPMTDPSNWWCAEKGCSMWVHCRGAK